MRAFITTLLVIVALPFAGFADDRAERLEAAREFAHASGMWQAILFNIPDIGAAVAEGVREEMPQLRDDQARDIRTLMNARFDAEQGQLLAAVSDVLSNHLTLDDLTTLTAYFRSQAGQVQAQAIARGEDMTEQEMTTLVLSLPPEARAEVEAFGNSEAARNWLAAQPRFIAEIEQVSTTFGENLVYGSITEIQAILTR